MIRQGVIRRLGRLEAAAMTRQSSAQDEQMQEFLRADPEARDLLERIVRLKHDTGETFISLFEQSAEARELYDHYLDRHREWRTKHEPERIAGMGRNVTVVTEFTE